MHKLLSILALALSLTAMAKKTPPIYTVPIEDASLKSDFGTFEVPDAKMKIVGAVARVDYTLPEFLAGEETIKIRASGTKDPVTGEYKLQGKLGDMDCTVTGARAQCHIRYDRKKLSVLSPEGQQAVESYIEDTVADLDERAARLDVFTAFSHEAAGDCTAIPVKTK